jgi:hypothetical protein
MCRGETLNDLLQSVIATPTITRHKSEPPKISPAAQLLLMGTSEDSAIQSKRADEVNYLCRKGKITECHWLTRKTPFFRTKVSYLYVH